ncbi:hypothetical protein NRIC_14000 [Enterococcus florum]|uniref:YitT family protein n=1 Tax=Enterococcus florum TaxID=2480627 RepID=A0A4V0WPD8_9ENTE|nr:hypothetical protein [Enterococcus florum]GCF93509.1 hypothetical protein NRIC_14000 [Enterococcus florum]
MIGKEKLVKQFTLAVAGTIFAAVGIRLIVLSGSGADAISTLVLGLMQHVPFQFGTLSMLFNILVLTAIYFYDRSLIGIGSIINGFGVGFVLNLMDAAEVLQTIPASMTYPSVILGTVIFGTGTAIYLLAHAGSAAYESLMIVIQRLTKRSVKVSRILLDGSFFLTGYLLGGTIGFGTVIVLLLTGPSLEIALNHLPRIPAFRTKAVNK